LKKSIDQLETSTSELKKISTLKLRKLPLPPAVQNWTTSKQGCQIFLGPNIGTKMGKICQMTTNCTKLPEIIPNGHKIYQHFPSQGFPKFTQIGIFGLKINHLATLVRNHFAH
jgi:hypothetical protein